MKHLLFFILLAILVGSISFVIWKFGREVHYKYAYKTMVEQTVKEMVMEQYLKK